jgi:hypothetical protein
MLVCVNAMTRQRDRHHPDVLAGKLGFSLSDSGLFDGNICARECHGGERDGDDDPGDEDRGNAFPKRLDMEHNAMRIL